MIRRLVIALVLLTAVSVTVGAAAVLPIGDSAHLQVMELDPNLPITTTSTTTTTMPEEPPTEPLGPPDHKVWVCVIIVDADGNLRLKPGKNPIHVSAHAQDALDAASPLHPSYVVENEDAPCTLPEQ